MGRTGPQPQDPSGGSRDWRGIAHDRVESLHHRSQLGRRLTRARHVGRRAKRASPGRSAPRRKYRAVNMPAGVIVSGLESNGGDLFFCGGGNSGKVRACDGRETLVDEAREQPRLGEPELFSLPINDLTVSVQRFRTSSVGARQAWQPGEVPSGHQQKADLPAAQPRFDS